MGTFLFYLFKSTLCLSILYIVFRLCFRSDTLFRTNRFLLLVGTLCCHILPFVQVNVLEGSLWQQPIATIETLLIESPSVKFVQDKRLQIENKEPEQAFPVSTGASTSVKVPPYNWTYLVCLFYASGVVVALVFFLFSMRRMWHLFHRYSAKECNGFRLIVCPQKQPSFSWGHTIVLSQNDYEYNRETVLLHERMHLRYFHTVDLLWMETLVIFHWFNPAVWLLMHELREIHEFEADNGVLSYGIDATQYQLLLVKKSVGTRLYSMASGFGHSKLKQRINMMLKKRTNGLARLKLLLFVPVVSGTLYAFARPQMKNAVEQLVKPQVGKHMQDSVRQDEFELLEQYFARKFKEGGGLVSTSREATHTMFVNYYNQIMIDQEGTQTDCADFIRKRLADILRKDYQQAQRAGRSFYSDLQICYDRGASAEAMRLYLRTIKEVYQNLRREVADEQEITDEATLDKVFPILVTFAKPKKYKVVVLDSSERLPMDITLISSNGSTKTLNNFSLDELRNEIRAFRDNQQVITVSLHVKQDVPMGLVTDVKEILREACSMINYSSSKREMVVEGMSRSFPRQDTD